MEFYLAMKKKEILSFAGKWMELEKIILNEVRLRKPKTACFLIYAENKPNANSNNIMRSWLC
jgi:hypothetical protein